MDPSARNNDIPLDILRAAVEIDVLPIPVNGDGSNQPSTTKDDSTGTTNDLEEGGSEEQEYPSGLKLYLAFLALALMLVLGGLDANIVATAVPSITDHFHTVADVGWYYAAYRLSACALQFPFGRLYVVVSTKWLFFASNSIFLLGSILCAAATSSAMFVLGRAVTGAGVAGSIAGYFKLVMDVVPPRKRPVFTAVFGAVEMLTGVVAPLLGGVITERLSWRWCFWINLPIGGASLVALVLLLPSTVSNSEREAQDRQPLTWRTLLWKLDTIGVSLLLGALVALFLALNWAGVTYPWHDPIVIGLFATCGALTICLTIQQRSRGDTGILPARLLTNRNVFPAAIFSLCVSSTLSVVEYYAPTYFQAVHGFTPTMSGYMMFPSLIGTLVGVLIQGSGTSAIGYYSPFMLFSSIATAIATGLMTTWAPSTGLSKLILYLALVGFGAGIGCLCPQNAATIALSRVDAPLGIALVLFAQNFGPALFVSVGQTIFTNRLTTNLIRLTPPGTNITRIEDVGLRDLVHVYHGTVLQEITAAFSGAVVHTWFLALGLMCFSLVGSSLLPWVSVKKKQH